MKYYHVKRTLGLPGKLERERGLPAARLAVEQRAARIILCERCVKHLKGLGTAYEIVWWRREKDDRRSLFRKAAHVAKALDPGYGLQPAFFGIGSGVNLVFNAEQFRHCAVAQ